MPLDFNRIKEIKLTDVVAKYGIALRFKGDYANCACPLPTHKQGDTQKSFSINLAGNFWRCFSESCNANNGGKRGGDCINFVAVKEGISQLAAAQKLADWFHVPETKTAPHMAEPKETKTAKDYEYHSTSADTHKYMQEVEAWFDATFTQGDQESNEEFRKRALKALKTRLLESYRNGQKSVKSAA